jgi:hypothetical protein
VRNPSHRRIKNTAGSLLFATLVGAALFAVLASGCGGGSGPSEAEPRERLEAGVTKLATAKSFEATVLAKLPSEPGAPVRPVSRLAVNVQRKTPLRLDARKYDLRHRGRNETREVLTIDNRAWVAIEPGRWSAATIDPSIPVAVAKGLSPSPRLIAAAGGIEAEPGRQYRFTAPAHLFFGSGAGGGPAHFVAALDRHGYLLRIRAIDESHGSEGAVTETFSQIGELPAITPPHPNQVIGPVTRIEHRREYEALLGPGPLGE